jgi:DNA-binding NtrC family response regulator
MGERGRVLVVDDEPNATKVLSAILSEAGFDVREAWDVDNAICAVLSEDVDVVVTDMKMPGRDGNQLFEYMMENRPSIPVIFLTAYGTIESAVQAMTRGAFNYFIKPPDYPKLIGTLARAVEQRRLKREIDVLRSRVSDDCDLRIVGHSAEMIDVLKTISAVKDSESSVLITGETGTGKELVAKALHYSSVRKEKPFIAVNCAAIPRELMESELFGYEKGAFTGAASRKIGRFEEASGGTVFLDEIGELDPPLQAKLLRALEEREIERLGSNKCIRVEFRLLSSTNRDLEREVRDGRFREDLFYRINVITVRLSPLRQRRDDIVLLASRFFDEFCDREKKALTVSDQVMRAFQNYHWPGNVRQLRNVIERAVVLARGDAITTNELPSELLTHSKRIETNGHLKTLKDLELQAVVNSLEECKGNKSKASKLLGISRKTFYKMLKEIEAVQT